MLCTFFAGLMSAASAQDLAATIDPLSAVPDASWEVGYQQRIHNLVNSQRFIVDLKDANNDPDAGKRQWPMLLAHMYKVRDHGDSIAYLINTTGSDLMRSKWAGSFYKPFTLPGYTQYYFQYKDLLPSDQLNHARKHLYDTAWSFLMRTDGHMDPIYLPPSFPDGTEFNSENFNWMARMGGYLFAHEFQDKAKIKFFDQYMKNWIRALYNVGRVEWNSNNYWAHTFNPLLVLYDNAEDVEMKKRAKAGLDWMVTEAALHYLDGFFAAGDVRAKSTAYKPFSGSVWGYNYLYFTDALNHPTYTDDFSSKDVKDFVGIAPYSTYRPPQVVIDIAQRKFTLPVEIRSAKPFYHLDNKNYADWKGSTIDSKRFEFETIFMDENYTLVSLASNRPDGRLGTFSEESLWRLAVKGSNNGALQIFGNAGEMATMAGRWPLEEIAQYRNVMVRLITQTDNLWIAAPKEMAFEQVDGNLFIDLGNGVYAALKSVNCINIKTQPFEHDASYQQVVWSFDKNKLGALSLEVGTEKQFGTYLNFKNEVHAKTKFSEAKSNEVEYVSASGNTMRMHYQAPTTYQLHIPLAKDNLPYKKGTKSLYPAGVVPLLWQDGKKVEYEKWNSYEVSVGEKIIDQKWGGGMLQLHSRDHDLEIIVDPADARVAYRMDE